MVVTTTNSNSVIVGVLRASGALRLIRVIRYIVYLKIVCDCSDMQVSEELARYTEDITTVHTCTGRDCSPDISRIVYLAYTVHRYFI